MASFDSESDLGGDVGYRLLAGTAVTLFWRPAIFWDTVERLRADGYQIASLDASTWTTEADLHRAARSTLDFPDYYGNNLDALNDCLTDVVDQRYGWSSSATGLVLAFARYDAFAVACPRAAHTVLDIIARQSRAAALLGRRLICLVQTDDPTIHFEPIGASPVLWNHREWLDRHRRNDT